MALNTKIAWCDHTWNPWIGCHRVSAECDHCYMYRDMERYGRDPKKVQRTSPATFNAPLNTKNYKPGDKVFVCSWSDFFHRQADFHRPDAFSIMRRRPDLRFIIVTKRIERAEECWPDDWGNGWPNVAVLVTAGLQETADERIPVLLSTRAAIRGVSIEPLLGPVSINQWLLAEHGRRQIGAGPGLSWVIVGGESGPNARPMHPDWVRVLRDQCTRADVPFFFKQWGEFAYSKILGFVDGVGWMKPSNSLSAADFFKPGTVAVKVGTKRAGFLLDGVKHSAYPKAWGC